MIKLNYLFEKNAIHKETKSFVSLIQVNGEKEINKKEKRKLNIFNFYRHIWFYGFCIEDRKSSKNKKSTKS